MSSRNGSLGSFQDDVFQDPLSSPQTETPVRERPRLASARRPSVGDSPEIERQVPDRDRSEAKNIVNQPQSPSAAAELAREAKVFALYFLAVRLMPPPCVHACVRACYVLSSCVRTRFIFAFITLSADGAITGRCSTSCEPVTRRKTTESF